MFRASKVLEPAFQEQSRSFFWQGLTENYQVDEAAYLKELIPLAQSDASEHKAITDTASSLIGKVRAQDGSVHMIDALLQEYSLDTQEGILLMCLAEALMRIPDKHTADALIRDKMLSADWKKHVGRSESTLVNASTWGLMLTGRVVKIDKRLDGSPSNVWNRLVKRSGEPVIRGAMNQAMAIMGKQFVLGRDINEALKQARDYRKMGYSYSFDMLGEAAMAQDDADRYLKDYLEAIEAVGNDPYPQNNAPRPSISIKLSALHPRYEVSQEHRVLTELYSTVCDLVQFARDKDVSITIDAEEMDRLELSLKLFEKILTSPAASGWGGFGLVIQAYSKRALPALCWLTKLAKETGDEIPIRLVKGAYWDTEIKMCQQMGIASYPVFTRKEATDTSYLACLRFLRVITLRVLCTRSLRVITRTRLRRFWLWPRNAIAKLSSSACTVWVTPCTTAFFKNTTFRFVSMPRWVPIKIYCRIWFAGCWKMVPTPRLYIAWSMPVHRLKTWCKTRCRNCRNTTRWRTVAFLGLWIFLASSAVIPAALIFTWHPSWSR